MSGEKEYILPAEDGTPTPFSEAEYEIISSRLKPDFPYDGKRSTDLSDLGEVVLNALVQGNDQAQEQNQ